MTITLIISMFPEQTMRIMESIGQVQMTGRTHLTGRFENGRPFKIVRPIDVPSLGQTDMSLHLLAGVRLRDVIVMPPAAISQEQKSWLRTRARAIIKEEFIR